ncbi:Transcription factor HEC3 [Spatholobus suberectus]|nr:Transcription factor HEC3 [Spatholobus suberectus]
MIEEPKEEVGAEKRMMFNIAAMQSVDIDPATIRKLNRRHLGIPDDPVSVATNHRSLSISDKIPFLQTEL